MKNFLMINCITLFYSFARTVEQSKQEFGNRELRKVVKDPSLKWKIDPSLKYLDSK